MYKVGRLDVQMQQLVRMHVTQAIQQIRKHPPDEAFADGAAIGLDMLLQGLAALEAHHHVDGVVGAEEVGHADDVGMVDARQRPALLEKTLHAVAEDVVVLVRAGLHDDRSLGAQHQLARQVFLDRHRLVVVVTRQIHHAEAAAADLAHDGVFVQPVAVGQRLVGLSRHSRTSIIFVC
jgi:hypothetical protein